MKRRVLMIAAAIVLALVGTGAVYAYVGNADARALAGQKAVDVLIVDKLIPAGTKAGDARDSRLMHTDHLPATSVPQDAVASVGADWASQVATADIQPGQVVLRQMFGTKSPTTSGLAIPAGKMAVSVKMNIEADVASYVQPGSQIAVFDTFILLDGKTTPSGSKTAGDKSDNWATKLLLPRVDVLAVSQAAPDSKNAAAGNNGGSTTALLVTVAVNQTDAERLIQVAQTGMPYAALLSDSSVSAPAPGVDNQGRLGQVFDGGITAP